MASILNYVMKTNLDDLKSLLFWRAVFGEFVGTFLLIFIGCFSCLPWHAADPENPHGPSLVQIALCFGILIGLLVTALGNVSGCHINPAVTIPMLLTRKISIVRAIFYITFQLLGTTFAIFLLKCFAPASLYHDRFLIVSGLSTVSSSQIMFAEAFITFVLVFTVYAACDSGKPQFKSTGPLTIGLSVTVGVFSAGEYTGGCMNPARAFGPAVITGCWDQQWIYWAGPILGGLVAGLLYDIFFDTGTSPRKAKHFLTTVDYDPASFSEDKDGVMIELQDPEELKRLKA